MALGGLSFKVYFKVVQKGQKGAKIVKKGYIFHILLNKLFQQKYHVVGVLCCAASDIEIKGQVSHFEMHFRDFSSFRSQCYVCKMDHIKEL